MLALLTGGAARAEPFLEPGRIELRVDLQTLSDAGVVSGPVTAWPMSWQSVIDGIENADVARMTPATRAAFDRVAEQARLDQQTHRFLPHVRLGVASEPAVVRSFSATPREDGELEAGISFTGDRIALNVNLTRAIDSEDDWRLDGSYLGFATRKWAVIAGYPERWWGPGMQGSLILSTNARPLAQIGVERISAEGFNARWLRWIGPWTVTSFLGRFDDDRVVDDALLFGLRVSARPLPQLEFAFSRTAQLCGDGRPCGGSEFFNMLFGRDNRGVNVGLNEEPGNQLAGLDGRWSFSNRPLAVYWQWIGEDTRQGGPQIGSWLRLFGAELTGDVAATGWRHRTYFEIADTICQQGGGGFGGAKYNCAYGHGIYQSGYRYEGRTLGHTIDADSESVSIISVWTGSTTTFWELGVHSARLNQAPAPSPLHGLSPVPARRHGLEFSHVRDLPIGRLRVRVGLWEQKNDLTGISESDSSVAVEWMIGYF